VVPHPPQIPLHAVPTQKPHFFKILLVGDEEVRTSLLQAHFGKRNPQFTSQGEKWFKMFNSVLNIEPHGLVVFNIWNIDSQLIASDGPTCVLRTKLFSNSKGVVIALSSKTEENEMWEKHVNWACGFIQHVFASKSDRLGMLLGSFSFDRF
jgi:hypothetical protein